MDWVFLYASSGTNFITSDNPFFIIPPPDYDPNNFWLKGFGIITPGTKKIFPLSQSVCLCMLEKGNEVSGVFLDKKKVRYINKMIGHHSDQFIIGRDKALLERIVKDVKADKWMKTQRIEMG